MQDRDFTIDAVGCTDIGLFRENNEDAFYLNKKQNIYIVADGMGGHNAGEVASSKTIEILSEKFNKLLQKENSYLDKLKKTQNEQLEPFETLIKELVIEANKEVYLSSISNYENYGMGTTLDLLTINEGKYYIAHVGDSRIYLLRKNKLKQLTTDHSIVQEMIDKNLISPKDTHKNPYAHVLTNAVGLGSDFFMDIISEKIQDKDCFLICSDGLSDMVKNKKIQFIMNLKKLELTKKAELLIETAKLNEGLDNITLILLEISKNND